jgi:predicted dehydrogenase
MDIGFIGAGNIAQTHLANLREMDRATVTAVCDVDEETAHAVADDHDATAYTDDAAMLDAESLDAVVLAVPPFAHDGQERRVVEAGADLFVEKPLALDREYPREVAAVLDDHDVVTTVGYVFRYAETVEFLREELSPGDVSHVVARYAIPDAPGASWWAERDMSGGQLVEQSTHVYDTLRYLFGDVVWAAGAGSHRHRESLSFDDTTAVTLEHDSGVVDTVVSTTAADETDVSLHVSGPSVELDVDLLNDELAGTIDGESVSVASETDSFRDEMAAFLDAVAAGDPAAPRCPYPEGLATLDLTLDVTDAVESGEAVRRRE